MNKKIIIGIGVVVGIILILAIILNTDTLQDNETANEDESTSVEELVERLPYEFTVQNRTVVFEEGIEPLEQKEEFAEVSELTEISLEINPLMFVEQVVSFVLSQEQIQDQDGLFDITVSFYSQGENKISSLINISNIPDDSVGATEERTDFILTEGNWGIEWHGQRVFCRRMDAEFWQPADQLCP